ncbi:MAG TPA: helix-turn-helix domain-containing protein [Pyrinomonadaceae bacterium]|nr:helix-turn-helix domain-containing protein [Pyrinomonadaceae bacterium]
MSLTLGEKLRQAREVRGITLGEVAEQTRISPLYIESIENDDYRSLPGGIFNKGFVKSFAKYVGIDEQEALQDYASLAANQNNQIIDEPRTYRPKVLTDDRSSYSSLPTIIFAVVILGLMTGGILFLVKYLQNNPNGSTLESANTTTESNANINSSSNTSSVNTSTQSATQMSASKIEFKALKAPVSLASVSDDRKTSSLITPEKPVVFEAKQNLKLSYSKSQAQNVQMIINGKQINLPSAPTNPKRNVIDLEITNDNLKQIWESGAISSNTSISPTPK